MANTGEWFVLFGHARTRRGGPPPPVDELLNTQPEMARLETDLGLDAKDGSPGGARDAIDDEPTTDPSELKDDADSKTDPSELKGADGADEGTPNSPSGAESSATDTQECAECVEAALLASALDEIRTEFGDEVADMVAKSPTLCAQLVELKKAKPAWKISQGDRSICDRGNDPSIQVRRGMSGEDTVRDLAHEVGHAVREAPVKSSTDAAKDKDEFVETNLSRCLHDEADALRNEDIVREEIAANGGPVIPPRDAHLEEIRRREKLPPDDPDHISPENAQDRRADWAGSQVAVETPRQTYDEYYGKPLEEEWDTKKGVRSTP